MSVHKLLLLISLMVDLIELMSNSCVNFGADGRKGECRQQRIQDKTKSHAGKFFLLTFHILVILRSSKIEMETIDFLCSTEDFFDNLTIIVFMKEKTSRRFRVVVLLKCWMMIVLILFEYLSFTDHKFAF